MFSAGHAKTPFELSSTRSLMEREKEHLRTARGDPSFLVSLILSYSKGSLEMGKDVPVGSEVL